MKETLEEVAERLCPNKQVEYDMFIEGAKWMQERSYSEEEFKEIVCNMVSMLAQANNMTFNGAILNELFNKFKKK